jgi:hypothetical protein
MHMKDNYGVSHGDSRINVSEYDPANSSEWQEMIVLGVLSVLWQRVKSSGREIEFSIASLALWGRASPKRAICIYT